MSQVLATEQARDGLPRPSTTRFALLILMICAVASFAAYWWLVAERDDWIGSQRACVVRLGRADPATGGVDAFNACMNRVALRQEGAVLLGPCTVIAVSLVVVYGSVPLLMWFWGSRPPGPPIADWFGSCVQEFSFRRKPRLVAVTRGAEGEARAFGAYPRYLVLMDHLLCPVGVNGELAAIIRHELAHLRAGDVDRARLAWTVWGVALVFVAPALTISIAGQGGAAWTALGLRLLLLLALVHLTYLSLLRAREHEADLLADAAQSSSSRGPNTPRIAEVLSKRARQRRYRSFPPVFLLTHPTTRRRKDVLKKPQMTARLSVLEFLSTGIAAGVIFQELALAVGAVMPGAEETGYWITGAIVAVPVCAVTITALWRHSLAGPGPLRRTRVVAAGALLGAGLLAGSQLSPRAAANWGTVRMTAVSPVLPSNLSLSVIGLRGIAAVALAAVTGCAVFMVWAAAFARELTAVSRHSPAWRRRVSTGLATAVLAIPLGAFFAVLRLAGDSVNGQEGTAIADLLHGRLLVLGLAATAGAALLPLLAAVMIRSKWAPLRPRTVSRAAIWCATAVLMPTAAWCAGAAVQHSVTPGPSVAGPGHGTLPLLPPAVTSGTGPIGSGIMCWTLGNVPPQDETNPVIWRQIGGLLERTPDQKLDFLGGELIRATTVPLAVGGSLAANAWLAAGFRCDVLVSTAPGAS